MKKIILAAAIILIGTAVNAQPPNVPADKGATFGVATTADNAITVEQLPTVLKGKTGAVDVKLKGVVTQVCEREGCWIKVKSPDGSMMVKMLDHKFVVPLVLNGKTIVINGTAEEKITTVEQLRHYAEDAGKSKEEIAKITEGKREVTVNAKGILVL